MNKKKVVVGILVMLMLFTVVACYKPNEVLAPLDEDVKEVEPVLIEEDSASTDIEDTGKSVEEAADTAEEVAVSEKKTPTGATTASNLPVKEVVEGDLVSFPNLKATDPDGDPIFYTFSTPMEEDGTWETEVGDAGEYEVTITASDGVNKATQKILLVVKSANSAPVITGLDDVTINEGQTVTLNPTITDADGDKVTVKYTGWISSKTYKTTYNDAGTHTVTVTASDGKLKTSQTVKVQVNNVNRAPSLEELSDTVISELDELIVKPSATDPDGDEINFKFSQPLNEDGRWQTAIGDAGKYRVTVEASDGEANAEQSFFVIVKQLNNVPDVKEIDDITVNEGQTVTLNIIATDDDGDDLTTSISGWMTSKTKQTGYDDQGIHTVTVTVSDGKDEVTQTVQVTVVDQNRPPVFDPGAFN